MKLIPLNFQQIINDVLRYIAVLVFLHSIDATMNLTVYTVFAKFLFFFYEMHCKSD